MASLQTAGLAAGTYTVEATWYPSGNQASNATYRVYDGSSLVLTKSVNQTLAPSGPSYGGVAFQSLGTVSCSSDTLRVVLGDDANGVVVADAVRIAPSP